MAVYDWELVGGDPAPGDPVASTDLGKAFGETATNAQSAHGRLKALKDNTDESIWRGKAADAFREEIDKLPELLEKLMKSYQKASEAMTTYGNLLRELQGEAKTAAGTAEAANTDESDAMSAKEAALYTDPTTPTAHHDDAAEAARTRLRSARHQIDDIRARRVAAEGAAVDGLDAAHDIGMKNKSGWQKFFAAVASVAELAAFTLAIVAIAVVVVVLLTNPAGWAALAAAFAAAGPLFTYATVASAVAFGAKAFGNAVGDEDITMSGLIKEGLWLAGSWGAGRAIGAFGRMGNVGASALRVTTTEFTQTVTEVRPLLRIITATDELVVPQARTTTTVVRITQIQPVKIAIDLEQAWNIGAATAVDIPKYLDENPDVARELGVGASASGPLAEVLGPRAACTAVHTPMPSR